MNNDLMNNEKNFCSDCGWNDCDYGCLCPQGEEVYQCKLYMYNHPDEVGFLKKK